MPVSQYHVAVFMAVYRLYPVAHAVHIALDQDGKVNEFSVVVLDFG